MFARDSTGPNDAQTANISEQIHGARSAATKHNVLDQVYIISQRILS